MKVVVPVSVREYSQTEASEGLIVAETLDPPFLSAAGPDEETTLADLQDIVQKSLERAHPRMLKLLNSGESPTLTRTAAPLYGTAAYDWDETANAWMVEGQHCMAPVDVLNRERDGGFTEVSIPLFGAWTVVQDGKQTPDEVVKDLADAIRVNGRFVGMHRPTPKETKIVPLEVEFTPLDLSKVSVDALWMSEFDDDDHEYIPESGPPPTPKLEEVAQCWTDARGAEAEQRGFVRCFGREAIVAELEELLGGEIPASVIVIGAPRVGKTAIIKHLAATRVEEDDPQRRIWFADPPRMTSTDMMGEWRQQCRELTSELEDVDDILYLGRAIEALDAGKYVGSDYNLAQFLKPVLADRRLRVVAEATVEEWNEIERRDVGFARCFTVVRVEEPPEPVARGIVADAVRRLSAREQVTVPQDAIDRAWALQRRFSVEGSTVGRTIDFVRRSVRVAANAFRKSIDQRELVEAFCELTGLPTILLLDEQQLDIDRVRTVLGSRVLGQDEAVGHVSDMIGITKAGLSSPDKPLGSFLFVGPTGVGKTELARALAAYLFGDEDRMVRIDMSEYSHSDAYSRLIGEGREDGDLTGPVRRQPFSLILLDEVEKAHPGVFDLLLQVLGEARLTDVNGKTTTFRNTIVIMTSNLGVDSLRPSIGFGEESVQDAWASHFRREAERFFRPEFLARIDQFIPFRPLTEDVVRRIAHREVSRIFDRDGLRAQDVEFEVDDRVYEWLAVRGWDQRYGARPLKRVIEQELVSELSRRLADTREELEAGTARVVSVSVPKGSVRKVGLEWKLELVSGRRSDASARRALLTQLEQIADQRRRLQRYTSTAVFGDLEWRVENFDVSGQSEQFWADPHASTYAQEAEHARRVTEPARSVSSELAAMEDLANEAYHGRSFALSGDIDERVAELSEKVSSIVLAILRGAYESPDEVALFLSATPANEPWREQLIGWYQRWAAEHGWECEIWRPRPADEIGLLDEEAPPYDEDRVTWVQTTDLGGEVIAVNLKGYACRALSRPEDGTHRLISADGNAIVDVAEQDEYADWPWAQRAVSSYNRTYAARVYNQRTREITVTGVGTARLDMSYPFSTIGDMLMEQAWRITESEWE